MKIKYKLLMYKKMFSYEPKLHWFVNNLGRITCIQCYVYTYSLHIVYEDFNRLSRKQRDRAIQILCLKNTAHFKL